MSTDAAELPLPRPVPTATSAPFWEALARDELRLQHCSACGAWVYYPRSRCPVCLSDQLRWEQVAPSGTVYAFTVSRRATAPMFAGEVPQVIAVVELDIGVRMTTTLPADADVALGRRVVGVFDHRADGATLLRFEIAP
jgi:uncharacterized protein